MGSGRSGNRRFFEDGPGCSFVESVHRGFEHHKEVEQVEGIGAVIVLVKIENGVGNEFVDERLSLAGHGTTPAAEFVKINEGATVIIERTLDLGGGNFRQTALVVLLKHPNDGEGRKSGRK